MIQSHVNFPSQAVSDLEKLSEKYGLDVAKAIRQEWFNGATSKFDGNINNFHQLRLYARGEQSIQKYKNELSINGDLSYLNLDWKPVPIIPKFVDIVVNGMSQRNYEINAYSQDQFGITKRTEYMESILRDMRAKEYTNLVQEQFGIDISENPPESLPDSEEELALHMQLNYKQAVELAEEQAINVLMDNSDYDLTRRRVLYDLAVLGIGATKTTFDFTEGVKIKYVDPANMIYSHTESPYFDDIYYVGEVKIVPINELVKEFPDLSEEEIKDIVDNSGYTSYRHSHYRRELDKNQVEVLYFNYKTHMNDVYKLKKLGSGAEKVIEKDDTFNPPVENMDGDFGKLERTVEVLYEGVYLIGADKLLKWKMADNMMRSESDFGSVKMNYQIVAPRMYQGRIESIVSRITGFADMIQLTHLKLQQVMSRMVPDGVYLDVDGLAEVDLGNGTNYNPQEALNMFFQTGSVIGRSFTSEGDGNPGKVPIQQINNGVNGGKIQSLIQTYNYYLQMIRDTTGLNEARDAATPDKNALVGVQKLAAANSNTATRHILQAMLFLTAEVAECLSLRISDIVEYSPTKNAFIQAIGAHNVATLEEMSNLHLHDFGIFIELSPDEEEKAMLENNIQVALAQQSIELEDAIEVRDIKNLKLANQLLKLRRKKKQARDEEIQLQNIQAQANANTQTQQAAAQMEIQKNQAKVQSDSQLEQIKADLESRKLVQEATIKKELMGLEFEYNMQLKGIEVDGQKSKEKEKEDRKDERTRIQATQQSELIDQRNSGKPPKNFESAGNDILSGGFDLGAFDPR
jgi:6-pyruvoyl-tetrahydropterin synthase